MRYFIIIGMIVLCGCNAADKKTEVITDSSIEPRVPLCLDTIEAQPLSELPEPPPPTEVNIGTINVVCECIDPPPLPETTSLIEPAIEVIEVLPDSNRSCFASAYVDISSWIHYIQTYLQDSADLQQIRGDKDRVALHYRVLADGTVADFTISGIAFGVEPILSKVVRDGKLKCIPATIDGQPVSSTYEQIVLFTNDLKQPVIVERPKLLHFDTWY